MSSNLLTSYLHLFQNLRVDRTRGPAPHKPVLLISVLQAVQSGLIKSNCIEITPELVTLFKSNWALLVKTEHHCKFSYPFFHLKSSTFWKLIPQPGFEKMVELSSRSPSLSELKQMTRWAEIESALFDLMKQPESNSLLKQILLDTYFPDTKQNMGNTSGGYNPLDDYEKLIVSENPQEYRQQILQLLAEKDEEEIFVRGGAFKREVPKIYNYTCCMSGLRIQTTNDIAMIDACHIIPFSESYDDTIGNGIALCPTLHRAFDRFLITVDTNYCINVSSQFSENKVDYSLKPLHGKKIVLPTSPAFLPSKKNLEWHNTRFKEYAQ